MSSSVQDIWQQMSGLSIYAFIWNMFGYCQQVENVRMGAAIDEADTKTQIDEKDAREKYLADTKKSADAYNCEMTGKVKGLGGLGIGLIASLGSISAFTSILIGAACLIPVIASGGLGLTFALVIWGACTALVAGLSVGAGFGIYAIAGASEGGFDSSKTFFAGGKNNLDENGNTKHNIGFLKYGKKKGKDEKAIVEYGNKASAIYTKLQDIQRQIQNLISMEYSTAQTEKTNETEQINNALKNFQNQVRIAG